MKECDRIDCVNNYNEFKTKHNELIEKMSKDETKYPKSLGIKKIV